MQEVYVPGRLSTMDNITAIVKGFMRPEKFENCLKCIIAAGVKKIIASFDGPEEYLEAHRNIVGRLQRDVSIRFLELPFNIGLSAARNRMIERVNTDYILMVDDDNYVPPFTLAMMKAFQYIPKEIGGIAMGWLPINSPFPQMDAFDIEILNGYFFRRLNDKKYVLAIDGMTFMYPFDFVPNQIIFKKVLFDDVQYDEHYVINREHEDFFLTCKLKTDWRFAVCTSIYSIHDPGKDSEYSKFRFGKEHDEAAEYFLKKWNLKGIAPQRYGPDYISLLYDGPWQFGGMQEKNTYLEWKLKHKMLGEHDVWHGV